MKNMWQILPIICARLMVVACSPSATNETSEATVTVSLFQRSLTPVTETLAAVTEPFATVIPSATPTVKPEPKTPAPIDPLTGLFYSDGKEWLYVGYCRLRSGK